jgi:hypothetical protein
MLVGCGDGEADDDVEDATLRTECSASVSMVEKDAPAWTCSMRGRWEKHRGTRGERARQIEEKLRAAAAQGNMS